MNRNLSMVFALCVLAAGRGAAATNITLDLGAGVSLDMVGISTGSFVMGDSGRDPGDSNNPNPAHTVVMSNAFHIGKYELTQAQWMRIMGAEPAVPFTRRGDTLPVENCTWAEARVFCGRLDALFTNLHFRLPTEAEWQYACRAGATTRYSFGDIYDGLSNSLSAYAWYSDNAGIFQTNSAVSETRPVGTRLPNAWGLYDMHGNISEFTHSLWARYPYDPDDGREDTDGIVGLSTDGDSLVVAGGGDWHHGDAPIAAFARSIQTPTFHRYYFGFRVVMVPRDLRITAQPAVSQTAIAGNPVSLSVAAVSGSRIYYQWRKAGANVAGATNATYAIPAVTAGDAGTYQVLVSNLSGVELSSNAVLTVNAPPVITVQPVSQGALTNTTVVFSVSASGSGLTYQWYKNSGTLIPGATASAYTTPLTTLADNGTEYYVVVSNATCGVASSRAVLTVTPAMVGPAITADPAGQSVLANLNQQAVFSVAASGTALAYQWQKDATNIVGKTAPVMTIANPQLSDGGAYRCLVSNTVGSVASADAILTVTTAVPPTITNQPVSASVLPGQDAVFTVGATGSEPLRYQWQTYISGGWPNIFGATNPVFTVYNTWIGDHGYKVRVVVSNLAGSVISDVTGAAPNYEPMVKNKLPDLTEYAPVPAIHPASVTVLAVPAQTVNLNVQLNHINTPPLVFELYRNGTNTGLSPAVTYTASTKWYSATFTVPAATVADSGVYAILVSNTVGGVFTSNAIVTVSDSAVAPVIVSQTGSKSVVVKVPSSTSVPLSVKALGTPTLTYQWTKNGTNISQATSSTYTMTSVNATNEGVYAVRVSNPAGAVTSQPIQLVVWTIPWIVTSPAPQTVVAGQPVMFSVAASGSPELTYQWLRDGALVGGATGAVYTLPSATNADDGAMFSARVFNLAGMAQSAGAALTVSASNSNTAPAITVQPSNQAVMAGQTASFGVTATGTAPLYYQWRTNGVGIGGATNAGYTTGATTTNEDGTWYSVVVSNTAGSVTSSNARLTVTAVVAAEGLPVSDTFEGYALGAGVAGTNGWSGAGGVVTAVTYEAAVPPGYPLPQAGHSRVLEVSQAVQRAVPGASNQNVTVDFMLQPTNGVLSETLGQTVQMGLAVDTQGVVQVWHSYSNSGVWARRWTALGKPALRTGPWVRVSVAFDYGSNSNAHTLFRPMLDGREYVTAYGVVSPTDLSAPGAWYVCADSPGAGGNGRRKISGFKLDGDFPSRLDDFLVTAGPLAYTPAGALFILR